MREVRPTVRALKSLPRDTFIDSTPLDLINNSDYDCVNLYGVEHPLLTDARRRFERGLPDRHKSASKAYGEPVYEVRDRDGAGWRGAVILDEQGDPWLVWAERHDQFHRKVAQTGFGNLLPAAAEYQMRDREEAAQGKSDWVRSVLTSFVGALRESILESKVATTIVKGVAPGQTATLTIETESDNPSEDAAAAHQGASIVSISLRISGDGWGDFESALTRVCLPFLAPNHAQIEPVFGRDGSLLFCLDITHAQVVQLLVDPPLYEDMAPMQVALPDRLHYVGNEYLLDGYVYARPLRGVCGDWFIATRSEECGLPICERCEEEMPAAERVLELLRSRA